MSPINKHAAIQASVTIGIGIDNAITPASPGRQHPNYSARRGAFTITARPVLGCSLPGPRGVAKAAVRRSGYDGAAKV
jgi:hypothetical protein